MSKSKSTLFQRIKEEREIEPTLETKKIRFSLRFKIVLLLSINLICASFFLVHRNQAPSYSLSPGYIWHNQSVTAEYTFPVYKSKDVLDDEIANAVENTLKVLILNQNAETEAGIRLSHIIDSLKTFDEESPSELPQILPEKALRDLAHLPQNQKSAELDKIHKEILKVITKTYRRGFISISVKSLKTSAISVRIPPNEETVLQTFGLMDTLSFIEEAKSNFEKKIPREFEKLAERILLRVSQPNLIYSDELTKKAELLASESIPKTVGLVRKGEVIVKKGDRITYEQIQKLQSYDKTKFIKSSNFYSNWNMLGSFGHATIIYSILLLYLFFIRKRIFYDNYQLLTIGVILIFVSFLSWLSLTIPSKLPIEYFLVLPAMSMLVAIVFDSRTAFYTTVTMALLVAGIRGNDYETSTAMLFAGTFAAYSVRDIQSRTQMYQSFFFTTIGFILPILAFGLERSADPFMTLTRMGIAVVNAAFSPFITFGLLFLLERTTNVATDLRIKEFDNLNHPLMTKLSEAAPGTYQHTLAVAALAERCARAIRANTLIAKVGAYYHDIGKIERPEYFVENQLDRESKHDLLPPKRSATAIREHVNAGIELAREYGLPQRLIDFIPMHHGTTLIKHFYAKALEENKEGTIKEEDFRYPGPKPNTKETAILMICDTAEAMSRLFQNNADAYEAALRKVVEERILDGQFDNCDITFKDLSLIQETCVKNLAGIGHQRVAYKQIPKIETKTPDNFENNSAE